MSTSVRSLNYTSQSIKTSQGSVAMYPKHSEEASFSTSGASVTDSEWDTHPLHSPNLSHSELVAYLNAPLTDPRHPNSLAPTSEHNPGLVHLIENRPHISLVRLLVKASENVIRIQNENIGSALPSPPITPVRGSFSEQQHSPGQPPSVQSHPKWKPLDQFILHTIELSSAKVGTLVVALVYLNRLKTKLPPMSQGMPCTRHRIFLAALICAAKYLNDSTPKNKHWAIYARVFETAEINMMERQLLQILNFDLRLTEEEVLEYVSPLLSRQEAVKRANAGTARRTSPQMPITPPHDAVSVHRPSKMPVARPTSVPSLVAVEREAKRVQATESNFVLKPVPKKKLPTSVAMTRGNPSSSHQLPTSSSAPSSLVPTLYSQASSDSGRSSSGGSVTSLEDDLVKSNSDHAAVHLPEAVFHQMAAPEKRAFLRASDISLISCSNRNSAIETTSSRLSLIPPSISLPAMQSRASLFSRILPRRGSKGV